MYPWPTGEFDNAIDVALDIAMNYLDRQWKAALAIMAAWKGGMRHPIKLADTAIKPVQRRTAPFLEDQKRG